MFITVLSFCNVITETMQPKNVIIIPGNGCTPIEECNWYDWLKDELEELGLTVNMSSMPDP